MRRQEKANRIGSMLDDLYPELPIPLDHRNSFELLVAVLLSAQTTDKKVNEVTPALFRAAPGPAEMAALGPDRILPLIRQLGLAPTKARNLAKLGGLVMARHGGEITETLEELEALPGVGHKTAQVVVAQAFGTPAFPVDTHIHRLAARWGLSSARNIPTTERDLKAVFARETWNDRHLQIIWFGRQYCPALYHDLRTCPICSWSATKKRMQEEDARNAALKTRKGKKAR